MLRFFPPVVTGTIILVIGINLMRVGINWVFGNPFGPTAPSVVNPEHAKWLADVTALGGAVPAAPKGLSLAASVPNPKYAPLAGIGIPALVLVSIMLIAQVTRKGFIANISVLLGIVIGARRRQRHGHHDLRQGGQGRLVRPGAAVPVRPADLRSDPDPHHDAGDDRGDDRIDRHVPGAGRDDRQANRPSRTWRAACAPTAWAR